MGNRYRILAIDFGIKKSGIAVSDEQRIIASGLKTVDSIDLIDFLKNYTYKENVGEIILGMPKKMDGSDSDISQNVRILKEILNKEFFDIKIKLYDERFTSKMAFQTMIDSGISKKSRKNKKLIDKISATLILQSYLQSIS